MDIISRGEALSQGLTYYFTGVKCKRGHVSRRLVKGAYCYECWKLVKSAWLKKTGKAAQYTAKHRAANRDAVRERGRLARQRNRETNPQRYKEAARRYYEANRDTVYLVGRVRRHELRQHTPPWVDRAMKKQMLAIYREAKTRSLVEGLGYEVDHRTPLVGRNVCGLHVPWNLRVILKSENRRKHAKTPPLPLVVTSEGSVVMPDFFLRRAVPKAWWEQLSDAQLEQYAQYVFRCMREKGFPYLAPPNQGDLARVVTLSRTQVDSYAPDNGVLTNSLIGASMASSFFPHMYEVASIGTKYTPMQVFMDDTLLMQAVRQRLRSGTYMSYSGMRKMLNAAKATRGVSNFRPAVAVSLMREYAPQNATVLDPCAGWGGRLLGAAMAENVVRYVGFEPSTATFSGLMQLSECLVPWVQADIFHGPYEDASPTVADFALTSPPYFDCERYASEDTQSWKRYPTPLSWRVGFLRPLIEKTFVALRPGSVFALNIANVDTYRNLETDALLDALDVGFKHEVTLSYPLPQRTKGAGARMEPVFILRRPE